MFNEKPGKCPYEENYYEEEIIKIQEDIEETDKEPIEVIDKVPNKKSTKKMFEILNECDDSDEELDEMFKESNKKSNKELNKESNKELNKKSNKESNKRSNKELIETISPKNDENTTNWYDKNKFNKILTTTDSNKLKFNVINDLINNIKNNTISEANAKKKINELNEIKKSRNKR